MGGYKDEINQVKDTVIKNLPECWPPLEACLSLIAAALLKDVTHCIGVILVGPPGGRKTTTIELLGRGEPLLKLDKFTPASLVSHDASKTEQQLQKIDLLPQIAHKIVVIPELGPLFTQRYEDLTADIGILTAVMDGKGYMSASGTHGMRGYDGDFRFGMIAGTVPPEHRVWEALGRLSSRWLFYRLEEATGQGFDLRGDFAAKKDACQAAVSHFIEESLWGDSDYGSLEWERQKEDKGWTDLLSQSAQLICKWRGILPRQDSAGYNPALVEVPYRLAETLYALARGHALLWWRDQITPEDALFAIAANNGNMPEDRARLYDAFVRKGKTNSDKLVTSADMQDDEDVREVVESLHETIGLREAARIIGCSSEKAKQVLDELVTLDAVKYDEKNSGYTWVI